MFCCHLLPFWFCTLGGSPPILHGSPADRKRLDLNILTWRGDWIEKKRFEKVGSEACPDHPGKGSEA